MVEFLFALIPSLFVVNRYGFLIGFMRLLVLGLLIGALLNPKIEREGEVILLRDVSGSMPEEFSKLTYPGAREVRFGSQDETNLEAALSEVSSDSVVLLSDGFETSGSALSRNYPFKIYPIIPDHISKSQAGILQIRYPSRIKKGTQGEVEIVAAGKGETLKIIHDGKSILEEKVTEEKVFKFLTPVMQDKVQDYEAIIFDGNRRVSDRKFGIIPLESKKTFVLGKETRLLKLLPQSENFEFVENLDRIDEAGTLILANISFKEISRYQEKLKTRVNEGLHLVLTGGNKSFGLGEYINTGLEPLFPVKLKPPEKEEKRLNVAVQLVLDKSQSMREQGRLNSAKDAASQVILTLKDDDLIGVIGFDQEPFEVIPISSLKNNRDSMVERLKALRPWGKTDVLPAIHLARERLDRIKAGRKHIIILTDGKFDNAGATHIHLIQQARLSGVTVSTVLIGPDVDGLMKKMAEVGGGAFYNVRDPSVLPQIFLKDIYARSGERTLKEDREFSVEPLNLTVSEIRQYPLLRGFVETGILEDANTELVVEKKPLLAWKNVGAGKVTAFTSDLDGRWTARWQNWNKTAQFIEDIIANEEEFDFEFNYRQLGSVVSLEFITKAGNPPNPFILKLGEERRAQCIPLSKGRCEAVFENVPEGAYLVSGGSKLAKIFVRKQVEEKGNGVNVNLLRKLAEKTGGEINPSQPISTQEKPLRNVLIIVALLIWLLEIFLRETGLTRK
jgi:hypothetical protein